MEQQAPPGTEARALLVALAALAKDNAAFFGCSATAAGRRVGAACVALGEQAQALGPALAPLGRAMASFDLDTATPGNGYRSLAQAVAACAAHAVHKSRYVAAHRRSPFFRAGHNAAELEAYGAALTQLRALLYLAQRLLAQHPPGCLFPEPPSAETTANDANAGPGLTELMLREYSTMHKGCFYGRCLGFQFTPSIRPFLQTIAISLVSFGENYRPNDLGLGVAAGSLLTSGKFAVDPELRGAEFERITQNLDVHFWKSFWNLTETQLLASVAGLASSPVRVSRALTVPPEPLELPLAADPTQCITITPPVAHTGPGPVHLRLLSAELREGQDSKALLALAGPEGAAGLGLGLGLGLERWRRRRPAPRSPALLLHFHGGGFVAQTSRSHEPYLRSWAQALGAPVLSVDYALAPEAPFPRALEECFYAYCWALRHAALLGWTGQRVCLAGDSAGGNLCLAVALRAAAAGVRAPDAVLAAYPVTLVQAAPSPSRLLALLDPLLPLGVLCQCLSAYAGTAPARSPPPDRAAGGTVARGGAPGAPPERALLLRASAWLGALLEGAGRRHGSTATPPGDAAPAWHQLLLLPAARLLGGRGPPTPTDAAQPSASESVPEGPPVGPRSTSRSHTYQDPGLPPGSVPLGSAGPGALEYPDGFEPLRSCYPAAPIALDLSPLGRNPYMSPLLAPDSMLRTLPPLHIVACALDPMLDDAVMLARRLRALGRPVTLRVVPDLPHGFLSLSQLCRETREATALCTRILQDMLAPPPAPGGPPVGPTDPRRHRTRRRASTPGAPPAPGAALRRASAPAAPRSPEPPAPGPKPAAQTPPPATLRGEGWGKQAGARS